MRMKALCGVLVGLLACMSGGPAADSSRGDEFLETYAATNRFRLGRPKAIRPTPQGDAVLFLRSPARSFVHDLYSFDVATGGERLLASASALLGGAAEELTPEELARRERMRQSSRGIAAFELSDDGRRVLIPLSGRLFLLERDGGEVRELRSDAGAAIDARFSPDGARVACVRDGDLYVIDLADGTERRLTRDGGGAVSNGVAEFVAQEEMGRFHGYWWSPDSTILVYQRNDESAVEMLSIVDPAHPENEPQRWPYPRPGKANADVRLGLIAATGGETTWIEWDRDRYEYVTHVGWSEGAPLTVAVQNRKQTEVRLLEVDPESGATSTLHVETDPAWLTLESKMPYWLPGGESFLWISEREGEKRLELRGRRGDLQRAVTPPGFGLESFLHRVPTTGELIVRASTTPIETHVWAVPPDPSAGKPRRISRDPGVHTAHAGVGSDVLVRESAPLDQPRRFDVLDATGRRVGALESVAERPGPVELELMTVKVESGTLHAAIVRPRDARPDTSYPVVLYVYGGPTSRMVRTDPVGYALDQWIADQGFVVVRIDGRGTPGRDRAWQRVASGELIGYILDDQVRGLAALGARHAELDLGRVGIYGWSYGGYVSAMAAIRRPDAFRAAVAGAPVVDWADYDTHYTERYLGLPGDNPEGYASSNVLTGAERLSRPLLLIHGTADDNVYFLHSLRLADALVRAGAPFDFLPVPGMTHSPREPERVEGIYRRLIDHFREHLGDPAPLLRRP